MRIQLDIFDQLKSQIILTPHEDDGAEMMTWVADHTPLYSFIAQQLPAIKPDFVKYFQISLGVITLIALCLA